MCARPASALAFAALAVALAAPFAGCERTAAPSAEGSSPPSEAYGPSAEASSSERSPLAEGSALRDGEPSGLGPPAETFVEASDPGPVRAGEARAARALIRPARGGRVGGEVRMEAYPSGVRVLVSLSGLGQRGEHGLHVMEARSCRGLDEDDPHLGASAAGARHGSPYSAPSRRHAGDLGNVRADGGRGRYDRIDPVLTLGEAVGRAVVVRAGLDDGVTAPDGGSGAIVGCGVLEVVR